jgi:protein SCO1
MRTANRALSPPCVAGLLAVVLATTLCACGGASDGSSATRTPGAGPAHAFAGAPLPAAAAHDFALTDERGRSASTREYRGRVVVLGFVSTDCGAPCVVIAEQIRGALDQAPARTCAHARACAPAVLLVSVDPPADTRAAVARFLARVSLSGRARYLSGPRGAIASVWRAFRVPAPARGSSAFDRFEPVLLLDRSGRARVAYPLEGLTPEALAHDIRALSG